MKHFFYKLKNYFSRGLLINNYNVYAIAFIGCVGHPLYWIWWSYIDPKDYENLTIRIIGIISCSILLTRKYWPTFFKKLFPIYWFFTVTYNLSFFFTIYLINSNFSIIWTAATFSMIYLSIMIIPRYLMFAISLILGVGLATIYCYLLNPNLILFNKEYIIFTYFPVFTFAISTGFIFSYSNTKGLVAQTRAKSLEDLGGSIAHEMRNPLGSIHQSAYILIKKLQEIPESKETNRILISKKEKKELEELLEIIDHSSIRGNMVIDMILSNIKGKDINKSKFKVYQISEVIETAIKEFAFAGSAERAKVSSNIKHDFYFKGDENMLVFVLFNLLKNALYYLKAYPKSRITISTKKEDKGEGEFSYLYFRDTGPGIPKDKLEAIFDSFMTSGKAEGTGLGLPFCRRVITAFDGKIVCNSEVGKYTEFTISFPKLSKEDEERKEELIVKKDTTDYEAIIKEKYGNKAALLADDQLVNRRISANRLEHLGLKVFTAEHGKDALKILETQGDEIDVIFMDLQMPEIDGYEATKLIKSGKKNKEGDKFKSFKKYKNIPIIAFTGDDDDETISKVKECDMQGHIGKSWNNKQLLEILDKAIS
jgi:two-component system, CAI-1 autoinducer sensor kinase/phosphatase CqsS